MKPGVSSEILRGLGVAEAQAQALIAELKAVPHTVPAAERWSRLTRSALTPDIPFAAHLRVYNAVFEDHDASTGPPAAWTPDATDIEHSNIHAFCRRVATPVDGLQRWSAANRAEFWKAVVDDLDIPFHTPTSRIVDLEGGIEYPRWLPGAKLNIAESCFHTAEDATAVIYQAEGSAIRRMSYGELDRYSNRVANSLIAGGMKKGDAVAIAMPMTVEAVTAYLGIVKAGCVVVSIADSFAPDEIATRLRLSDARAVVTQDVVHRGGKTLPMYEKVVDAGAPWVIVAAGGDKLAVSLREKDSEWREFLVEDSDFEARSCDPGEKINILFSSGTTGNPKAIPWTHTTPIKCAMDGYLHHDIHAGDVVAWPTNIGWMMGPWLIFASLVNHATMALHYGAPNTPEFCRFVQDARVNMLGVVPSLVRAWRTAGMADGFDWTAIRVYSSTGEASNAEDMLYLMSLAGYRPVIEYCGGTEIGGGYITGTVTRPASPSTFSTPAFGLDIHILDEDGRPARTGEVFIVPPSIGLSNELLNRDHHDVYYAGTPKGPSGELLRRHGDQMEYIGGGYFRAQGRADDTMNLGGIKVSSAEIERVVSCVKGVSETAAVAVSQTGGGPSRLVIFAVADAPRPADAENIKGEMQRQIAKHLNPLFRVHDVILVDALPRTASNKVMRRVLRARYEESPPSN